MWKFAAVVFIAALPHTALACGGSNAAASAKSAADCAKSSEMMGANCSYATGKMAQRVLAEGDTWQFTGSMKPVDTVLANRVSAPFVVGPEGEMHIIANQVVEEMVNREITTGRVSITGRTLTISGTTYILITEYAQPKS